MVGPKDILPKGGQRSEGRPFWISGQQLVRLKLIAKKYNLRELACVQAALLEWLEKYEEGV